MRVLKIQQLKCDQCKQWYKPPIQFTKYSFETYFDGKETICPLCKRKTTYSLNRAKTE